MKITIDTDLCTGHGRCYVLAPALFTDDESGFGQVVADGTVPSERAEEAAKAVRSCPERAISLVDE